MSETKGNAPPTKHLTSRYLILTLVCYVFINLAFILAYTPLFPNEWWGPLALTGLDWEYLRWTQIAFRFFITLLPLFATAIVGLWWFMQLLHPDPPSTERLYWASLFALIIALPFFAQLPHFMATLGFDLEHGPLEAKMQTLPIFFVTILTYLLLVSTATASHPFEHLKQLLLHPLFWIVFIPLCLATYLPFMGVIFSALSGSEGAIYVPEFMTRLVGILIFTIPLAFLIPSLLLCFVFPSYIRNPLLRRKDAK
ncbi:MAG: hypothetical protein ACFFDU_02200 [Candidatus Thorarchaeota archaeon]